MKMATVDLEKRGLVGPMAVLNPIARLFLAHLNPLFKLGSTRVLEQEDLGMINEQERVHAMYERFVVAWKLEQDLPADKR